MATAFLSSWIQFFGPPRSILTDNGTNFTSKLVGDLWAIFSVKGILTTPYHPQANPVERFGRTLNTAIAKYVAHNQSDWVQFLGLVTYAYNTSIHSVTGVAPATAVFKVPPTTLLEFVHMVPHDLELRSTWGIRGRDIMESALRQCQDAAFTRKEKATTATSHDPEAEEPFGLDDIVWLADRHSPRDGRKAKHTFRHTGPYRVVSCNGHFSYTIRHLQSGVALKAHYEHLTLASEDLQRKYRLHFEEVEEGGLDTSQTSPSILSQNALEPISTRLGLSPYANDSPAAVTSLPLPDADKSSIPYTTKTKANPSSRSFNSVATFENDIEKHTISKTTRGGRTISIPKRYLTLFVSTMTGGKSRHRASSADEEDPEEGRM